MSSEEIRVSDYIVVCISEFAQRHRLHMRDAYTYLERYKGIAFLKEFYDVEHTLSFDLDGSAYVYELFKRELTGRASA